MNIELKKKMREVQKLERMQRRLRRAGPGNFRAEKMRVTRKINVIMNSLSKEEHEQVMREAVDCLDGNRRWLQ